MRRIALCVGLLGFSLPAQDLELKVDGGSFPGQIDWSLDGGQAFRQFGILVISSFPGPTPLAALDPTDTRVLRVGLELLAVSPYGAFIQSELSFTSLQLPNLPSTVGVTLYLQGVALPGTGRLIDRITTPVAVQIQNANTLQSRAPMQNPRAFFDMLPMADGSRVVAGGGQGALLALIGIKGSEIYDPITDSFAPGPDLTVERAMYSKTELRDGTWLLSGGVNAMSDPLLACEIYDGQGVAPVFTATGSMAKKRFAHTSSLLPNGRVLVTGGIDSVSGSSFTMLTSTEVYDPTSKTWSAGPTLSEARVAHLAITLPDKRIMLIGGIAPSFIIPKVLDTTEIYDPVTNSMSAGPTMSSRRAAYALVKIGAGRWLVAGGVINVIATTATAEIFDASTMTFTAAGSMSTSRALLSAFNLGGKVVVLGGASGSLLAPMPNSAVDLFDVASGTWTAGPSLATPRAAYGAYKTDSGQVHVLGGDGGGIIGVQISTVRYYR